MYYGQYHHYHVNQRKFDGKFVESVTFKVHDFIKDEKLTTIFNGLDKKDVFTKIMQNALC